MAGLGLASLLCLLFILSSTSKCQSSRLQQYGYEDSDTCGQPTRPPGGGRRNGGYAEPQTAPWQARLCLNNYPLRGFLTCFCGGVLVSTRFILTAAHCFNEISNRLVNYHLVVKLGNATYYPVRNGVVKHYSYEIRTYDHDIALIQLSRDVIYTPSVQPACLPDPNIPTSLGAGYVTGWGGTGRRLREFPTTPVRWRDCVRSPRHRDHIITTNMFCARETSQTADLVKGFSGGPLVSLVNGQWVLQGLVSWGIPGQNITVFTEVAKYSSWLEDWGIGW